MTKESAPNEKRWVTVGESTTSDIEYLKRAELEFDDFYVVVGFEVNVDRAFQNETHDLNEDYGHAFYYLVKNLVVTAVLSFGPAGYAKNGWLNQGSSENPNKYNTGAIIKDGATGSRLGTPDYIISETVTAFKIKLNRKQAEQLKVKTGQIRDRITAGKEKYAAYLNDTCAETARDALADSGIETPSGSGWVKHSGLASIPLAYAVNPYKWHHNFLKSGAAARTFELEEGEDWLPQVGGVDEIFGDTSSE